MIETSVERRQVLPDPERITESLRDTGYDFNTAIADLVDNSIAADATVVRVHLGLNPRGDVDLLIVDNGSGMNTEGLENALTYGSKRRDDKASLGKFGLGLKTATTAFARKLTLTSRDAETATTAVWDLDDVAEHGWTIAFQPEPDPLSVSYLNAVTSGPGTTVRWEKVDRVLRDYANPVGGHAQRAIERLSAALIDHLAMVFQRFLDSNDERARTVQLFVNDKAVSAWDPFGPGAEVLIVKSWDVVYSADGSKAPLHLRAVVLPRKADMNAAYGEDASTAARLGNDTQGIYVYRENRLIHGPDWLGFWTQEPHSTLARVELDFGHELDGAFQIDVKKSRIVPDQALGLALRDAVSPAKSEAQNRYRATRKAEVAAADDETLHAPSNAAISDAAASIRQPELTKADVATGEAEIRNDHGPLRVKYVESSNDRVFVEATDSLNEGLLYEPAFIGQNPGVRISKAHPYYDRVYLPNRLSGSAIQGLDSLLWALANAELKSSTPQLKATFEDIRFDVSRALRRLVEDLPESDEIELN